MYSLDHLTENSLVVHFSSKMDISITLRIATIAERVRSELGDLLEVVPSSCSLYVEYDILKTDPILLESRIKGIIATTTQSASSYKTITLPCYYDPSVAPDLLRLAEEKQLSIDEVIQIHSNTEYTVCSTGFAPGFAYLSKVDQRIATPRLSTPRSRIPAGSVGIADQQTAVYPSASPAGWNIIGNCPLTLFDINATPISPFTIGDKVKFTPITRDEFIEQGGQFE